MKPKSDDEKIERYRKSLLYAWGFRDYNDWPIKLNSVFHLFLEEFGEEFWEDLAYLEEVKSIPLETIAKMFHNPARIYRLIDYLIYGLRRKKQPLSYQRQVVLKLLSMIKALKNGSEFNEDGRNIIYSPQRVAEIAEKLSNRECRPEEAALIHRFCGLIWAYTESIFFRAHDVTKEIHGPYRGDSKNSNIIVKEYLNLRPDVIWPDVTLLPFNTIKIYKNYNDNPKISIDSLNHLYHKGGDYIPNLKSYHIEIDGKEEKIEALMALTDSIGRTISEITVKVDTMSWREKVKKYADIFWYRKKPLRDARGLPWEVPEKVKKKIFSGEANPKRATRLSEEQVCRLAMITI